MATGLRDRPFAAVLGGWVLLAVVFWLAIARLIELMPRAVVASLWAAVFLAAPLALLLWAAMRAVRKRGSWLVPPAVVVAAFALLVGGIPLFQASIYLNFWSHRAAYDAVVADAKAGRLGLAQPGAGVRRGVRVQACGAAAVCFPWGVGTSDFLGVIYDEAGCRAGDNGRIADHYCLQSTVM